MRLRGHRDEGASALEFALILPLLIVLVFGVLYGGIVLNDQLSVTQAAREGARFGATLPIPAGQNAPDANWYAAVRTRAEAASAGTLGAQGTVCAWFIPAGGGVLSSGNPAGCGSPPGNLVSGDPADRVVVTAQRPGTLNLVLYSFPVTLSGRAVARHEGGIPS
jgi:Flp pilus assembly protein TadG